jgi:acyl-coenzyme A thioesterase PaaI-like protein
MVIEAVVVDLDDDGAEVLGADGVSAPVAWSTLTFAVLPGGNRNLAEPLPFDLPPTMDITGAGLTRSVTETLGMVVEDAAAGRVSLPVHPYLHNSIRGVQGGVMALLGEVAAAEALGAALGRTGGEIVITDLQVAYLALGRVGPIVTRTTVLDTGGRRPFGDAPGSGTASAVVELNDSGAGDRTCTVINARGMVAAEFTAARPAPPGAAEVAR